MASPLLKTLPVACARLMDNTQFLYELQLASLEISTLAGKAEMSDDLRSFTVSSDGGELLRNAAYVADVSGEESFYSRLTRKNATRSMNQYITHWFYPYKGKFHPQMTRALANIIGMRPGEILLDPFCGSGTAIVEGALLNLKGVGFDISPLCVLISKVKTNAVHHLPKLEKIEPLQNGEAGISNAELQRAMKTPAEGFELLARLISLSDKVRRRRNFSEQLLHNHAKMLDSVRLMKEGCDEIGITPTPADVRAADARQLPIDDNSVDGVITSPPYSIALNYVANDSHALRFLGFEPDVFANEFIGVRGTGAGRAALYEDDMQLAYAEIARVLRPGRSAAIVLGNATVGGERMPTVDNCEKTFRKLGFELQHKINKIIFGLYNVMQREDILIFRKKVS